MVSIKKKNKIGLHLKKCLQNQKANYIQMSEIRSLRVPPEIRKLIESGTPYTVFDHCLPLFWAVTSISLSAPILRR